MKIFETSKKSVTIFIEILSICPIPVFRKGPVGIPKSVLTDSGRNPATFSGLFLETASLPEVPCSLRRTRPSSPGKAQTPLPRPVCFNTPC